MSSVPTEAELLKAKPILFNTEMVKAILDGRKTQFREVISGGFLDDSEVSIITTLFKEKKYDEALVEWGFEAKYQVGDILYVMEEYLYHFDQQTQICGDLFFKADDDDYGITEWEDAKTMPPKHARIFLKVTNVRVERLQDITDEDIKKEGIYLNYIKGESTGNPMLKLQRLTEKFISLWDSTSKNDYKWKNNRYVLVCEFERVDSKDIG